MGGREDVRPGSVLQVRGRLLARDSVDAERLVVLNGLAALK
jgi:hypothetical protein